MFWGHIGSESPVEAGSAAARVVFVSHANLPTYASAVSMFWSLAQYVIETQPSSRRSYPIGHRPAAAPSDRRLGAYIPHKGNAKRAGQTGPLVFR
jgi:hypothetical protein